MKWQQTGAVAPRSLTAARLQLHYGALMLASAAHSLLAHADDDSHTNLGFDPRTCSLHTHPLDPERSLALYLDLPALALVVRNGAPETGGRNARRSTLPLAGQTLESSFEWVREQLSALARAGATIALREYPDFPESPLMHGGAFEHPGEAPLTELGHWFANGRSRIESLRQEHPRMSDPRVWPHHFDLGALVPVDAGGERTIGLGLSPGDHHYDQPYFYCSPYPPPERTDALPALAVGHWHTQDMVSAVATAEELQAGSAQAEAARAYLEAAIAACFALLGSP